MGLFDNENKVPRLQREYQAAMRNHVRIWNISPRSPYLLRPYYVLLVGCVSASAYGMGRKILGYNTFF